MISWPNFRRAVPALAVLAAVVAARAEDTFYAQRVAPILEQKCVACHGENGKGGISAALAGGAPLTTISAAQKRVANYFPYSTTVFDFIRRAMPWQQPRSLTIHGRPVPKGRARVTAHGTFTPERTRAWEAMVASSQRVRKRREDGSMVGDLSPQGSRRGRGQRRRRV
jgi:hypothetical protein